MTDPIERELKDLLDERARGDPFATRRLADGIATLPARRGSILGRTVALAASGVLLAIVVVVGAPRLGGSGAPPTHDPGLPGGPEAFAADPRLARCFLTAADMEYVFEIHHARDFQRYLPNSLRTPELEVDDAAFVVIYRATANTVVLRSLGYGPRPLATNQPGHRDICVLVDGDDPILYGDVDITGLTIDVIASEASPTPAVTDVPTPEPTLTPPPAPAWVAGLADQLECDGPVANIGGEVPEAFGVGAAGESPDAALASFLGPNNPFASLPAAGYKKIHADDHWASYAHVVEGRTKAIIVLTDANPLRREPGWLVIGLRACDPSEFDPSVPLTFPVTIWTDAAGNPISTDAIRSSPGPGHCGWDAAIWLDVGGNLYFRDPDAVMREWTTTLFDPKAELPASAVDTGFRSGEWSLWLEPGGDAYLVSSRTIERWPRSTDAGLGCA
jgi:hypothetical protein